MHLKQHYQDILPMLRLMARTHGYALTLHGSGQRDLDLVAIPWTEDAKSAEVLVTALAFCIHAQADEPPIEKPHGRWGWVIQLGGGLYIDLSVMPRQQTREECVGNGS